jgi:hypothetical protein
MKHSKKCTALCSLESLHSPIFNQGFNKILGGGLNPSIPNPTGNLVVTNASKQQYDHTPEGPEEKRL